MVNDRPRPIRTSGRRAARVVANRGIMARLAAGAPFVYLALVGPVLVSADASAQRREPKIVVAAMILAKSEAQTPLPIEIGPPGVVPPNSFVRVRGLPATISLTEGYAIRPGSWAVPLFGLPTLKVNVPTNVTGRSELLINLVSLDGSQIAEARTVLVVASAPVPAPVEQDHSLTPPVPIPAGRPQRSIPFAPRQPQLSPEQREGAERLVALGDRYLEQGNIEAARQFFRRAADIGLADGAIGLAATYDPAELARLAVQGVVADRAEARRWYERARDLGAPDAEGRLAKLGVD
jgi:hypothetical protein